MLTTATAALAVVLTLAACASSSRNGFDTVALHRDQPIAASTVIDALRAHGFTVTGVFPDSSVVVAREWLDAAVNLNSVLVNTFDFVGECQRWQAASRKLGDIAVAGPTWAISLGSDSDNSRELAPRIADALGAKLVL